MSQRHFTTSLAIALVLGLGGAARAQDGNLEASALNITPVVMVRALAPVLDQSPVVANAQPRSNDMERRPPQASPSDPSKDSAPPDVRHIRRALGGFVGGLVGLGVSSLAPASMDRTTVAGVGVSVGILLGAWLGGR